MIDRRLIRAASGLLLICYSSQPRRMPLRHFLKKGRHDRFERFNIVVSILLAGWVRSILTVWFSYAFLTKMLESKILRDRQTFVHLISRLVGDDLGRTHGFIDYDHPCLN